MQSIYWQIRSKLDKKCRSAVCFLNSEPSLYSMRSLATNSTIDNFFKYG